MIHWLDQGTQIAPLYSLISFCDHIELLTSLSCLSGIEKASVKPENIQRDQSEQPHCLFNAKPSLRPWGFWAWMQQPTNNSSESSQSLYSLSCVFDCFFSSLMPLNIFQKSVLKQGCTLQYNQRNFGHHLSLWHQRPEFFDSSKFDLAKFSCALRYLFEECFYFLQ